MDYSKENQNWDSLSYVEKNHQLYLKQKALLNQFLEKGANPNLLRLITMSIIIKKMETDDEIRGKAYVH